MSQYPNNQAWSNRVNDTAFTSNSHQPPAFAQGAWQPQQQPFPPQVPPTQQTYLNNNVAPKGPYSAGPPQGPSWSRVTPQQPPVFQAQPATSPYQTPNPFGQTNSFSAYPPQSTPFANSIPNNAIYSPQQYYGPDGYQQQGLPPAPHVTPPLPQQFANNFPPNPLQGPLPPNSIARPTSSLQAQLPGRPTPPPQHAAPTPPLHPSYQATPPLQPLQAADEWGWGWDESSSDSTPATSTPNNNWGSQTPAGHPTQAATFASAQNYFQPGVLPPRPGPATPSSEISREVRGTFNTPAVLEGNPVANRMEGPLVQEQQAVHSTASNDEKRERVSPDPRTSVGSTPLTKQALSEFYKEPYANGPSSHRLGTEALTPQWSIESQMSQETVSDDASPSLAETSDIDHSNTWHEEPGQNHFDRYPTEEIASTASESITIRTDLYSDPEMAARMSSLSLTEQETGNKEVISPEQPKGNTTPAQPAVDISYATPLPDKIEPRPDAPDVNYPTHASYPVTPSSINVRTDSDLYMHPELASVQAPPVGRNQEGPWRSRGPFQNSPRSSAGSVNGPEFPPQFAPLSIQRVEPQPTRLVDEPPRQEIRHRSEEALPPLEVESQGYPIIAASPPDESFNLETVPDNVERPDQELRARNLPAQTAQHAAWPYSRGPDNNEVSPHSERDQYLETEQLTDQCHNQYMDRVDVLLLSSEADQADGLPPPGLSRLVTGEGHNIDMVNDISAPPAGLDRMVLGQITERDSPPANPLPHGTQPPAGLRRMVLGQVTDEPSPVPSGPRLVPGESSSPEAPPTTTATPHTRVVPGVASEDNASPLLPLPDSPGIKRQIVNEIAEQPVRSQPQAERSETIGEESVTADPPDTSAKSSKRREKEYHREDISSDERDSGRRGRDGDYYRERDRDRARERDDSPSGDRRRVEWDRRRRHSPQRYREYRDDRRRRREYDYSDDEDAETGGYNSDRTDRDRRNMSYRDDYDRGTYPRRDDRARSLKPDKQRDRPDDRKEKEKRRGYDRERDRDSRQGDYYRRRDDHEDYREQRSRPSSRNDSSVHDFKERGMSGRGDEREHYRGHSKRDRDAYYQQQAAQYNYDPAMYYYYQQYYENLRRTNPAAYTEYYRKFYASSQQGTYSEDRASVHSGRSSADETKDRVFDKKVVVDTGTGVREHAYRAPQMNIPHVKFESSPGRSLDASLAQDEAELEPQRLTPTKFTTAHAKGVLTSRGQLINILAHYPLDGQPATVQVFQQLACLQPCRAQLEQFPGPLVKNVTHKKSVMDFCEQKIADANNNPNICDKDSYKLIWEFFHLLLRQNGQVVGTDIAELLMNPARISEPLPAPSPATSHHSLNELPAQQEDDLTNKYRNLLIYGNTKAALEWAMKHGLWGHALFLASKMDQRTYASVMTRFANGLSLNDPLQTLYQLMSGRQPAAVTCCFDEKWGDWRPHLAMILSNSSGREDVKNRAIATLGDTLSSRGALYAAHFCYMLAQIEFGSYSHKSSKLVLITASHSLSFQRFATNEAIFATEIFEYALSLAGDFVLPHFQVYKLLMAQRLAEVGLSQEAVHYTEVIASTIVKQPSLYTPSLIQQVYDLGDMLKLSDPVYTSADNDGADPIWLQQLQRVIADYQIGALQHQTTFGGSISNLTTYSEPDGQPSLPVDVPEQPWQNGTAYQQPPPQMYQQQWPQEREQSMQSESLNNQHQSQQVEQQPEVTSYAGNSTTDAPSYWTPPAQPQWTQPADSEPAMSPATPSGPTSEYYDNTRSEAIPTITLPGSSTARTRTTSQSSDSIQSFHSPRKQSSEAPKSAQPQQQQQQGSGWFGGLFSKLSLRPKNQMILPDDKNPSIVWDADKNRWVNQNAGEDEGPGSLPPPPMMGTAAPRGPSPPGPAPSAPTPASSANLPSMPASTGANVYKMPPRGRNIRTNYVDVMNPGGKAPPPSTVPAPDLFPSLSYSAQPNLFVPPPVEGQDGGMNLFTPTPTAPADQQDNRDVSSQGMSRWSSASSLSREVQAYTRSRPSIQAGGVAQNGQWNNGGIGGTLPRTKRSYK